MTLAHHPQDLCPHGREPVAAGADEDTRSEPHHPDQRVMFFKEIHDPLGADQPRQWERRRRFQSWPAFIDGLSRWCGGIHAGRRAINEHPDADEADAPADVGQRGNLTLTRSGKEIADRPARIDGSVGELELIRQIVEQIHLALFDRGFTFTFEAPGFCGLRIVGEADDVRDFSVVGDAPKDRTPDSPSRSDDDDSHEWLRGECAGRSSRRRGGAGRDCIAAQATR